MTKEENKNRQTKLLILFVAIFLIMLCCIISSLLDNKVGSYVKENNITEERGIINTTSSLIPIEYNKEGKPVKFLRDTTPIYYGFFILLFLILLIIAFDNRRYEDIEDDE